MVGDKIVRLPEAAVGICADVVYVGIHLEALLQVRGLVSLRHNYPAFEQGLQAAALTSGIPRSH